MEPIEVPAIATGFEAQLVQRLQHDDMGKPARRAAAQRQGDAVGVARRGARAAVGGHAGRLRVRRLRPASRFLRGGGSRPGRAGLGGLARQHALELALQLLLGRLGRGQHLLEAVELQHVELVDIDVDVDVGLAGLELLAHDRALQDLRGRDQRGKRRGLRPLARPAGGAGDIDGDGDVGRSLQHVEGQRVDEAAVHQQAAARA